MRLFALAQAVALLVWQELGEAGGGNAVIAQRQEVGRGKLLAVPGMPQSPESLHTAQNQLPSEMS